MILLFFLSIEEQESLITSRVKRLLKSRYPSGPSLSLGHVTRPPGHMVKQRVGVEHSPSMVEPVRPGAVSPDRALCLPTFSHFLIVNKTPLSFSLSPLSLSHSLTLSHSLSITLSLSLSLSPRSPLTDSLFLPRQSYPTGRCTYRLIHSLIVNKLLPPPQSRAL
jgi:hypothetical protein